mgnify:FL=1
MLLRGEDNLMIIFEEVHESGWGEHDFLVKDEFQAMRATKALSENGYRVGGGTNPRRVTIDLMHNSNVDKARDIIEKIDTYWGIL